MLELAPGTSLGAYVITGRIGRGGMATVYQAHHPALDRDVAIKVLWQSLAAQPGFLERFRREARAASRLRHPNILTVYDFGESDGMAFMVTELLPGGTLADRLGRPLPFTEALRVLRGIGAALDSAHQAGLIHRDVKPSNILFTRDGEPVLADFGIARLVEAEEQLTASGTLIGTPHYMAPEMVTGGDVGPASDRYSLGVVLYEMLTGEPPFPRPTPIATVRAHVQEPPPPLSAVNPAISREIEAVVARALSKDPADRYRSGAALAAAFEEALLAGDPPTPRPGSTATWGARAPAGLPPDRDVTAQLPPPGAPPRARAPYDPAEPYDAIIPGPPRARRGGPGGRTERWPQAAPRERPRRRARALALLALLALALAAIAFVARSTDLAGRLGVTSRAGIAATPTPGSIVTITPTTGAAGAAAGPGATSPPTPGQGGPPSPAPAGPAVTPATLASPVAEGSPVAIQLPTATVVPSLAPTRTPTPAAPTATPDPRRGPLAVQIVAPANGATVPARPPIVGRRTGVQGPDEHLWLLIHPDGGPDNWWPYKNEVIADRDGNWRVDDVEIGGPAGSRHILAVGVADAATHQRIVSQIRDQQDEPFAGGQPPGFRELARATVVKR
jgi:hypothetical protein